MGRPAKETLTNPLLSHNRGTNENPRLRNIRQTYGHFWFVRLKKFFVFSLVGQFVCDKIYGFFRKNVFEENVLPFSLDFFGGVFQ